MEIGKECRNFAATMRVDTQRGVLKTNYLQTLKGRVKKMGKKGIYRQLMKRFELVLQNDDFVAILGGLQEV